MLRATRMLVYEGDEAAVRAHLKQRQLIEERQMSLKGCGRYTMREASLAFEHIEPGFTDGGGI